MQAPDNEIKKLIKKPKEEEAALFYALMDIKGFEYVERPVQIDEFVLSDEFLDLEKAIRPKVLDDLKELFCDITSFAYCPYEEAVFDEAIGSGKGYKASIITAYYLYHLLCLKIPQKAFKLDPHSPIHIMNMSINALQARKVVFGEIKNRIMNSLWFQQGRSPDPNVYSELRFPHNINIIPGHSGELFPLGYSLVLAIMDEAAFYTQTETHDVAKEMFYTLKRRIKTRFGEHGLLVIISSPRYIDDFIELKIREAKNDKTIFCKRHAIWEVMPEDIKAIEKEDCFELQGEKIPNKYQKDFEVNPEKAWRDLGARPSLSLEPYFKQWDLIEECIDPQMKNPLQNERFIPNFKGKPGCRYYIHIDLGLMHDACGFAMGHLEGKLVIIDLMMQIKPRPGEEIDIKGVMNWIPQLSSRGFRIAAVTYDQFQCTRKGTKIRCLNSENMEIQNFKGGETVYSIGQDNKITFGIVKKAWRSGYKKIFRVWLDNGEYIDCSGNHPFMMRDSSYKEAKDLKEGDSLMPLYIRISKKGKDASTGYEMVYQPLGKNGKGWDFTHKIVARGLGITKKGLLIHHCNANKLDNRPENIKTVSYKEHEVIHREVLRKGNRERWANPESHTAMSQFISKRNFKNNYRLGTKTSDKARENLCVANKKKWEDPEYREKQIKAHLGNKGYWLGKKRSQETKDKISATKLNKKLNHNVIKIEELGIDEVWDIEIEGHHNFALSAGVFVHNSASSIQELNKMSYKAGRLSVEGLEAYETFKEKVYAKEVRYYRYEPFLNEMRRLELVKGKKVDHAINASKDVSDAVCGVVYNVIISEQMKRKVKVFY